MYGYPPPYYPYRQQTSIKTVLIITGVVLTLIIGIYLYLKKKAEDSVKEELPSQYADANYTADESRQIRYLATAMQGDLSGINWNGHDGSIYVTLRDATDRIFIATSVDYKRLTGSSLRQDLISDESSFKELFVWGGDLYDVYKAIIARMNTLNVA